MPKDKHTAKKKIAKKIVKKSVKQNVKQNVNPMSKLEYEQALTDPRFRAAMQGFNNPANNINQIANQQLHEQETRNNELTRQISFQNDMAQAKQANLRLKDELSTAKLQHSQELSAKQLELSNQQHKHEMEILSEKWKHNGEILKLNAELAAERQKHQDAQTRWKQKEEKFKAEHDLEMQKVQSKHDKEMNELKDLTNGLARKTDLENLQFNAAQDIANATVAKAKAEIQKDLQEQLLPLKDYTNKTQAIIDLQKQLYDSNMEMTKANHDALKSEMILEFQNAINPIKEQTQAIKNLTSIEETKHNETQKLLNQKTELINSTLKFSNGVQTQRLDALNEELKRKDDILRTQSEAIRKFKDSQANLIEQNIKSHFDPMIQQLNMQTQTLSNINNTSQLLYNEQSKLQNANFQLNEAQIKAINEPLIRQLENQKQQLENIIKANGDVNGLYQKMEDIKTQIEVLKQKATPEQIQEHGQEIRDITLAAAPLQISKRLAEQTYNANLEREKQYSRLVELGAQALGEEFNVNDIGKTVLNDKLKTKLENTQKERAIIAAQQKELERQIKMQEGLENDKIENVKLQAKADYLMNHTGEYNQNIYNAGLQKAAFDADNERLHNVSQQLEQLRNTNDDLFVSTLSKFERFINDDKSGFVRKVATDITKQHLNITDPNANISPDPRSLPELIPKLREIRDQNIDILEHLPRQLSSNSNNTIDDLNKDVLNLADRLTRAGVNVNQERNNLRLQIDTLTCDRNQALEDKNEAQQRAKQSIELNKQLLKCFPKDFPQEAFNGMLQNAGIEDYNALTAYGDNIPVQETNS